MSEECGYCGWWAGSDEPACASCPLYGSATHDAQQLRLFDVAEPAMSRLELERCTVQPVNYATAKTVLEEAHYIGKPGSTQVALGLYADNVIGGVITFGTIATAKAICGPEHASEVLELTRLTCYPFMPENSESWFIAQSFRWLSRNRPDIHIIVSYADPSAGHIGYVYQATNFLYTGMSSPNKVFVTEAGEVIHTRGAFDIRRLARTQTPDTTTAQLFDDDDYRDKRTGRAIMREKRIPIGHYEDAPAKHRYVNFIGSRSHKKALRRALRWPVLPYPKPALEKAAQNEQPA